MTLKQGNGKPAVKVEKQPTKDVLQDFPMRDYEPNRSKNFFASHHHVTSSVSTEGDDGGHMSSLRDSTNANYLPANLHVRFGKPGLYHMQNQTTGGALPDEAYKPQEISNRGTRTKELSASKIFAHFVCFVPSLSSKREKTTAVLRFERMAQELSICKFSSRFFDIFLRNLLLVLNHQA